MGYSSGDMAISPDQRPSSNSGDLSPRLERDLRAAANRRQDISPSQPDEKQERHLPGWFLPVSLAVGVAAAVASEVIWAIPAK